MNAVNANTKNVDLSIEYINNISIYANRVTASTLQTGGVIKDFVEDFSYIAFCDQAELNSTEQSYLQKIAAIVERLGQLVDDAIAKENSAINRKEVFSKIKMLGGLLEKWQPLEKITEIKLSALYEWYKFRIDIQSRMYLRQMVDNLQFMEVENE